MSRRRSTRAAARKPVDYTTLGGAADDSDSDPPFAEPEDPQDSDDEIRPEDLEAEESPSDSDGSENPAGFKETGVVGTTREAKEAKEAERVREIKELTEAEEMIDSDLIDIDESLLEPDSPADPAAKKKMAKRSTGAVPLLLRMKYTNYRTKRLDARILQYFGTHLEYSEAVEFLGKWSGDQFLPNPANFGEKNTGNELKLADFEKERLKQLCGLTELEQIDESYFLKQMQPLESVKIFIDTEENPREVLRDSSESIGMLKSLQFSGNYITQLLWLAGRDTEPSQKLVAASAASVYLCGAEPASPASRFLGPGPGTSFAALTVYSIDTTNGISRPEQRILLPGGAVSCLKAHPRPEDGLAELLAVLTDDGALRLVDISCVQSEFSVLTSCATLAVPGRKIISFDWRSATRIICGLDCGSIAEFDLTDSDYPVAPSFIFPIHDAAVSNVCCFGSAFPNLVFLTSYDFRASLVDLSVFPLRHTILRTRSPSVALFSPFIDSIVGFGKFPGCRASPIRWMEYSSIVTNNPGTVSAASVSPLHPLLAAAGSDGGLVLSNLVSNVFINRPGAEKAVQQIVLWRLEYSRVHKAYRMSELLLTQTVGEFGSQRPLYPPQANLTTCAWNPNVSAGTWLATANCEGIIRIEHVG